MKNVSDQSVSTFVRACREAAQRGLMRCSSGNLSWRVDPEHMLVTATRSWASRLTADDVVLMRTADGAVLEGRDPTIEVAFHAGILRARPDIDVVMHFQTTYATMLACQDTAHINFFVIPEIPVYIGPIGHVPFLTPGSQELADAVIDTIHFSGGHTSLECFAWGIPVATWPSYMLPGRLTYGFYRQMGVMDCVAWDQATYVDIAHRLANDLDWRETVSRKILERSDILFENRNDVIELGQFFEDAVKSAYSGM